MDRIITRTHHSGCLFTGWMFRSCFTFFLLLAYADVSAGTEMGLSITYRSLDSNRVEVILTRYRHCGGLSWNADSLQMGIRGGSVNATFSVSRTAIEDITPICKGAPHPCNPANTTITGDGVEQHIYKGIVDFSQAPYNSFALNNVCEVFFFFIDARNIDVNTIAPANNYTEAMMNRCLAPTNSSPVFMDEPVFFQPSNSSLNTSHTVIDTIDSHDVYTYGLVAARSDSVTSVVYNVGYSGTAPFDCYKIPSNPNLINPNAKPPIGICFFPEDGTIIATTTGNNGIGPVVVKVSEFRIDSMGNKRLIGTVMRDVTLMVRPRPGNNPPSISGPFAYTVTEGKQLCFRINSFDKVFILPPPAIPPPPDTIELSWNNYLPGATFTVLDSTLREKTLEVCWTPSVGMSTGKPYRFSVTAKDNNCNPSPGIATQVFKVTVTPVPKAKVSYERLRCGIYEVNSTPENKEFQYIYSWKVTDTSGKVLTTGYGGRDTLAITQAGIMLLSHTISFGSVTTSYLDTILVDSCVLNKTLVHGNVFFDSNSNCNKNLGEPYLYNQLIRFETPAYHYYVNTDSLGHYQALLVSDTYTVKLLPAPYYLVNCPDSPSIYNLVLNTDTLADSINWGIKINPNAFNVRINLTSNDGFVLHRGPTIGYCATVENLRTFPLKDARVTVTLDSLQSTFYSNSAYLSRAGNKITWAVPDLPLGASHSIFFYASVPPSTPLETAVIIEAELDSLSGIYDPNPDDNQAKLRQRVVAAIDPNDKQSEPQRYLKPKDKQIQYVIRFQNTGTAPARQVKVVDTIDTRLPLSDFHMNVASHPYRIEIAGNVVTWIFDNINLADSGSNELESHGFISFSIRLLEGLLDGSIIDNRVDIYFDYEPAIRTNIASLTKVTPRLSLITPLASETLVETHMYPITWENDFVDRARIDFSSDSGNNWVNIVKNIPSDSLSYTWTVPSVFSKNCFIRISDERDVEVFSAVGFEITDSVTPKLRMVYPVDAITWYMGDTVTVRWNAVKVNEVFLEISIDSGYTWALVEDHIPAFAGNYDIQVPYFASTACLMRVTAHENLLVWDQSPVFFKIEKRQQLGVSKISDEKLLIYPNPASQEIVLNSLINAPLQVEMTDVLGKTIALITIPPHSGYITDIAGLTNGIYILRTPYGYHKLIISH